MKQKLKDNGPLLLILTAAFLSRFLFLQIRPPHFDEGINGWFVDQMWVKGFYDYDPTNYHGPLHFYFLQLSEILFGRGIWSLRFVSAILSTLTVGIVFLHREFIGRAALWATLIVLVSPGTVFMGRYAIHEAWIPFSLMLFNYGFMRWYFRKDQTALICVFAGIALALLNKETAVIHFFAWTLGYLYLLFFHKKEFFSNRPPLDDILIGIVWVLIALLIVYGAFGLHFQGSFDFFRGFLPWLKTGSEGRGHEKAWIYWLVIAKRYEFWVILSLTVGIVTFAAKNAWRNYFLINALVTFGVYSMVKYKTPWCAVSVFCFAPFPLALFIEDVRKDIYKDIYGIVLMGFAVLMIWQTNRSYQLNYVNYASPDEDYVYVHTTKDYFEIVKPIEQVMTEAPRKRNMGVLVSLISPWPLPWTFGKYPGLTFSIEGLNYETLDYAIVEANQSEKLEKGLKFPYFKKKLRLRTYTDEAFVYYKKETFEKFVKSETVVGPGI